MPTRSQLLNPDYYAPVLSNAIRVVFILVFAYLATRAIARLMRALRSYSVKMMLKSGGGNEFELEKRAETIQNLASKALFVLIWIIAGLMILEEMNFDVRPLLAGAAGGRGGSRRGHRPRSAEHHQGCPGWHVSNDGESDPRQ
jgi:small-conductance mechanosensitive channel